MTGRPHAADVIVTIPAAAEFADWRGQFAEHPDAHFIWTVRKLPADRDRPERIYFVHRGFVKGWCALAGSETDHERGAYLLFAPPLVPCPPVPIKGFRGWRYLRGLARELRG